MEQVVVFRFSFLLGFILWRFYLKISHICLIFVGWLIFSQVLVPAYVEFAVSLRLAWMMEITQAVHKLVDVDISVLSLMILWVLKKNWESLVVCRMIMEFKEIMILALKIKIKKQQCWEQDVDFQAKERSLFVRRYFIC